MPQLQPKEPLSRSHRTGVFVLLLVIFLAAIPFLYFYATGFRFDTSDLNSIVRTGGIFIGVERTGAEIYIDGELVRETRTFRKAFYAQNLAAGTHRVHVQKDGYHTWVKELPVTAHRVTEAQAFNLPLVPQVRVIAKWQTATGTPVVTSELVHASTTNSVVATTTKRTNHLTANEEYATLMNEFVPATTTATTTAKKSTLLETVESELGEVPAEATTTKSKNDIRLSESSDGEVVAVWTGSFERMPYYYCAEAFPPYSTTTDIQTAAVVEALSPTQTEEDSEAASEEESAEFIHPVQVVDPSLPCEPQIQMDRKGQNVTNFDFVPHSTDLVFMALEDGLYMTEIDDRGWQNMQPVLMGKNLDFRIVNDAIYVYDGVLMYQVVLEYS